MSFSFLGHSYTGFCFGGATRNFSFVPEYHCIVVVSWLLAKIHIELFFHFPATEAMGNFGRRHNKFRWAELHPNTPIIIKSELLFRFIRSRTIRMIRFDCAIKPLRSHSFQVHLLFGSYGCQPFRIRNQKQIKNHTKTLLL